MEQTPVPIPQSYAEGLAIVDHFKLSDPDPNSNFVRATCKENGAAVIIKSIPSFFIEKQITCFGIVAFIYQYKNIIHPAIAPLHALIVPDLENPAVYRFVSEYKEKGSLVDLYKEYPFAQNPKFWTSTRKSIIAFGIAASMQFLQSKYSNCGFLSPYCILFDKDIKPYLSNFWYSIFYPRGANFNSSQNKYNNYISPEAKSMEGITRVADVYSFGVILYELAYEDPVYNKKNFSIDDVLAKEPVHSDRLYSLILSCLSTDPVKRPSFDFVVSSFYDDVDQLFFNTDINNFSKYRYEIMSKYIKELSQIDYFEYGNNPINERERELMRKYAQSCGYLKPLFLYGRMTKQIDFIKFVANKGNKSAQYYYSLEIEKTNPKESFKYLMLSSQQFYIKAINKIASLPNSNPLHVKWAADFGCVSMQVIYALRSSRLYYLRMAAKKKDGQGLYLLGLFEETGRNVRFLDQICYQKAIAENSPRKEPRYVANLSTAELIAENIKLNSSSNDSNDNMMNDADDDLDDEDDCSFPPSFFKSEQKAAEVISSLSETVIYKNLYSAISHYNGAASLNNSEAIARLEMINSAGEKMYPKMEQIFQQNDPKKSNLLIMYAMMLLQGCFNVGRDKQKAKRILILAAHYTKSPDAQFQLSKLLLEEVRKESNSNESLDFDGFSKSAAENSQSIILYLRAAANSGHAKACMCYGHLLFNERHATQSALKESMKYIRQAANCGNIKAMIEYAKLVQICHKLAITPSLKEDHYSELFKLYFNDKIRDFTNSESIVYFRIAADRGSGEAQFIFGKILEQTIPRLSNSQGDNLRMDRAKSALFYYKLAAHQAIPEAMLAIAELYDNEKDRYLQKFRITDRDVTKKYLVAASRGSAHAMRIVAERYVKGLGVKSDTKIAMNYYKAAAILGDYTALYRYGHYYAFNRQMPSNDRQLTNCGVYFLLYSLFLAFSMNNCLSIYNEIDRKSDDKALQQLDFFNTAYFHLSNEFISRYFDKSRGYIRLNELKQSFLICRLALRSLAYVYIDPYFNGKPDYNSAIYYMNESVYFGNTDDKDFLGLILKKQNDLSGAFKHFQQGSLENDPNCLYGLALSYEKGVGTQISFETAADILSKLFEYKKSFILEAARCLDYAFLKGNWDPKKNGSIQISKTALEHTFNRPLPFINNYLEDRFSEEETQSMIKICTYYYQSLNMDDVRLNIHGRLAYHVLNLQRFFHATNTQDKSNEYNEFLKNVANENTALRFLEKAISCNNDDALFNFAIYIHHKLFDSKLYDPSLKIFHEESDAHLIKLQISQLFHNIINTLSKKSNLLGKILYQTLSFNTANRKYIFSGSGNKIRKGIRFLRDVLRTYNRYERKEGNIFNSNYYGPSPQKWISDMNSHTTNSFYVTSSSDVSLILSYLYKTGLFVLKNHKVASYMLYTAKSIGNYLAPPLLKEYDFVPDDIKPTDPLEIELDELYTSISMDALSPKDRQYNLFRITQIAIEENNWKAQYYISCILDECLESMKGRTCHDYLRFAATNIINNNIQRDPNSIVDPATVLLKLGANLYEANMFDSARYYIDKAIEMGSDDAVKLKLKLITKEISRTGRNLQPSNVKAPLIKDINQFYITLHHRVVTPSNVNFNSKFFLEDSDEDEDVDFQLFVRKQVLIGRDIQLANFGKTDKVIQRLIDCYFKRKDNLDAYSQCNFGLLLKYATDENLAVDDLLRSAYDREYILASLGPFMLDHSMLYNDNINDYDVFLPDNFQKYSAVDSIGYTFHAFGTTFSDLYSLYDKRYKQISKRKQNQKTSSNQNDDTSIHQQTNALSIEIVDASNHHKDFTFNNQQADPLSTEKVDTSNHLDENTSSSQEEDTSSNENDQNYDTSALESLYIDIARSRKTLPKETDEAKLKQKRERYYSLLQYYFKEGIRRGCIESIRVLSLISSEIDWLVSSNYNKIGASLGDKLSMFRRARDLIHAAVLIGYRVKNKKRTKTGCVTTIHSPPSKHVEEEEEEKREKERKVVEITDDNPEENDVKEHQAMYGRLLMREARTYLECYARTSGRGSYLLGTLYECGELLKKNYVKAFLYYSAASALGYADALLRMAALLAFGGFDLEKDEARSLEYAKKAAFFRIPEAVKAESEGIFDNFDSNYIDFMETVLSVSQTIDESNLQPNDNSANEPIQLPDLDINWSDPFQSFNENQKEHNLLKGLSINTGEYGMTQLYYTCFGENGVAYRVSKYYCDFDCDYEYQYEYEEEEEEVNENM